MSVFLSANPGYNLDSDPKCALVCFKNYFLDGTVEELFVPDTDALGDSAFCGKSKKIKATRTKNAMIMINLGLVLISHSL